MSYNSYYDILESSEDGKVVVISADGQYSSTIVIKGPEITGLAIR